VGFVLAGLASADNGSFKGHCGFGGAAKTGCSVWQMGFY